MCKLSTYLMILVASILGNVGSVYATHIIGGELTYVNQGNTDFEFTLKLYRDCGPGNTNGTGFDPSITLGFFSVSNALLTSTTISGPAISTISAVASNPCFTTSSTCVVQEAIYVGSVTLPANVVGGITAAYQRCCRNPTILNLIQPNVQGITVTAFVPEFSTTPINSSPRFTTFPPVGVCVNTALSFSHAAFDPDGDQLVYSLCDPFQGATPGNPNPGIPTPPPYNLVNWGAGFSGTNPLLGTISIDPSTGQLSALPTTLGQFVVGVCVQEFRNGVFLSEVKRDFQFNVAPCVFSTVAAVQAQQAQQQQSPCNGLTIDFVNQSVSAVAYHWDFGVAGITSDTSSLFEPSYTFPDTGTYEITLVANPGFACADTSVSTFEVFLPLTVDIVVPDITCFDAQPLALEVLGNFSSAATVDWDLDTTAINQFPSGALVDGSWTQPGFYEVNVTVMDNGCVGTAVDTAVVFPNPMADFTWDPQGCEPFNSNFVDNSSAWTSLQYAWAFGDGGTSTVPDPSYLYTANGAYDLSLTVFTDSGCVDTATLFVPAGVLVHETPVADFTISSLEVNVLDPTVEVTDQSFGATAWEYTTNGLTFNSPDFMHTFNGGGFFTVTQTVTNDDGCSDTHSDVVTVLGHLFFAPNAFTPNGDGTNDVWLPSVQGALTYELSIFDRWGQLIFNTADEFEPWDGQTATVGVYQYRVRLRSAGGFPQEYLGHFSLIR